MTATTDDTTQPAREALTAELIGSGALRTGEWIAAFTTVPRHVFVPAWFRTTLVDGQARTERLDGADPVTRADWLAGVYADQHLMISPPGDEPSSSTQPSLMASMLEALALDPGMRVLEVGTGSGYNAALLCERSGSANVTTVDINPTLVDTARDRLASLGYTPAVHTAHGGHGYPPNAPYDRIIATCGVPRIPTEWIEQTQPNGIIVAPLAGGLVRVREGAAADANGRFVCSAYFMPLRSDQPQAAERPEFRWADAGNARPSPLRGADLWDNTLRFMLTLAVPGLSYAYQDGPADTMIWHPDGSWCHLRPDGTATTGGPRDLTTPIEAAHETWTATGRPVHDRYRITITPAAQLVWLDEPDSGHAWNLPQPHG